MPTNVPIPVENQILCDIRASNFKVVLENGTKILPTDLIKYRISINEKFVTFTNVKYDRYDYFKAFDDLDFPKTTFKMYDTSNLMVDTKKCMILTNSGKSYSFQHFLWNVSQLNDKLTANPNFRPSPVQCGTRSSSTPTPTKSKSASPAQVLMERATKIETTQDPKTLSLEDIIWYLRQNSNNRLLDETQVPAFKERLQLYDNNYLYEQIFLNKGNYSQVAIAILFTFAPFFYTYPRFYATSFPIIIIGAIGLIMCIDYLKKKYMTILKLKDILYIYVGAVVGFYLLFFVLMNKLNHITLFFMSAGIVFLLLNYILRIVVSDPQKGLGKMRLFVNVNNKSFTPFNPNIERVSKELIRRFDMKMDPRQLYLYITSFELTEKSKGFQETEFACNIVQPILGVVLLYVFGQVLTKSVDNGLLPPKVVDGTNVPQPFLKTPIIGYLEESIKVMTNQYNYWLPKEINHYNIMEKIIDEVTDKVIRPKGAPLISKGRFGDEIIKNLDKHLRRFLRFVQDEYRPMVSGNTLKTMRLDNRGNPLDGTYNQIDDVLRRAKLITFRDQGQGQPIFSENLFVELIRRIEENNQVADLEKRNSAVDNIKYKFKDIYDYITNEELFTQEEQEILLAIIEEKIQAMFKTLYSGSDGITSDSNGVILGNVTPDGLRKGGNALFGVIIKPIAMWVLLGKLVGSAWWAGRSAMADITKRYESIMRSYEYEGNFSTIWKICSMGADRVYYEGLLQFPEMRPVLQEKMDAVDMGSKTLHYGGAFGLFLLFGAFLNAYNNMAFGMTSYPLWTNLPGLGLLLAILVGIAVYRSRKSA
jgi:hypothetical protein